MNKNKTNSRQTVSGLYDNLAYKISKAYEAGKLGATFIYPYIHKIGCSSTSGLIPCEMGCTIKI